MPRRRRPRRRRTAGRRLSLFDLDFPQTREVREVEGLRDDVQPQLEMEGLNVLTQPQIQTKPDELPQIEGLDVIARLLEPVRSADELADLKMALNDALRLGKQTVTTPRKPSSRPPEFVDEEEELM